VSIKLMWKNSYILFTILFDFFVYQQLLWFLGDIVNASNCLEDVICMMTQPRQQDDVRELNAIIVVG
jgi:hypothetical protein